MTANGPAGSRPSGTEPMSWYGVEIDPGCDLVPFRALAHVEHLDGRPIRHPLV